MKAAFLLPVLFLMTVASSRAQLHYGITAGGGFSYAHAENVPNAKYGSSFLPQADLFLVAPLSSGFSFQAGFGFKNKGYTATSVLSDDQMQTWDKFRTTTRYSYLQVPALVLYKYELRPSRHALQAGAGLYYGFLLRGRADVALGHYSNGNLVESSSFSYPLRTGLTRSGVEAQPGKRTDLLLIDCGLKLQLNYIFRDHFMAGICYEHSFYDINARSEGTSSVKMRYTGFSLGYIF